MPRVRQPASWLSLEALAQRCRAESDVSDLGCLIDKCNRDVTHVVRSVLGHRHAGEVSDVVQDVWEHVLRQLDHYAVQPDASFKSWLRTVVRRRAHDRLAALERQRPFSLGAVEPQTSRGPDVHTAIAARELLDAMEPELRALIVQHGVFERPMRELAEAWGINERTLWSRFVRGVNRLKGAADAAHSQPTVASKPVGVQPGKHKPSE